MSRTNIDLDDDMLGIVMRRYKVKTKTEAVDMALRRLAGMPMTIEEALSMEGANNIDPDLVPDDTGPK